MTAQQPSTRREFLLTAAAAAGALCASAGAQTRPPVDPNQPPDIPLSTYKPEPTLHVPVHPVDRASFPVIDVHSHLNDAGAILRPHTPAEKVVGWMDRHNIERIVILTGAWGERLERVLNRMVRPYPDRFTVFTQLDWSRIDEPGFGEKMAAQIRESVARGARGLKITKHLGLLVRDKSGKLVRVDDRRLDPCWAECGRLAIPVSIHVGDPEAFFLPIDSTNERYEQLRDRPEYRFRGGDFPQLKEILDALERVFDRFPQTAFVSLHFGNWPENLEYVGGILDRYPNVFIEFGARQAELGRKPNQTRKFFLRYSERILFGTDGNDEMIYPSYFRWLETDDDYFDAHWAPSQGRWKIYGLHLPADVLEKVYCLNARKVLGRFKGPPIAGA